MCSHTHGVSLFNESREQQTIKCTKCALWTADPATLSPPSSTTLGIITQSHWSQLSFHSGPVRSTCSWHDKSWHGQRGLFIVPRYEIKKRHYRFGSSRRLTRHRLNLCHLSARTASFTTQKHSQFQIRLFAINVHCKKNNSFFFFFFTCILYFAPLYFLLLCWTSPSRFLKLFNTCKNAGLAEFIGGFCALLSTI